MTDNDILTLLREILELPSSSQGEGPLENLFLPVVCEALRAQPELAGRIAEAVRASRARSSPLDTDCRRSTSVLLTIEGIDGSGKGTQAELLVNNAQSAGLRVGRLSFPRYGETVFSRLIADYLNGRFGTIDVVPPQFSALLFAGDRFESRQPLEQMLAASQLVVLDRYVASNVAYHAARVSPERRRNFIRWLHRLEFEKFALPVPTANILLDVPVDITGNWILQKGPRSYTEQAADIHERRLDYMQSCREMFLTLSQSAEYGRWTIKDCVDEAGRTIPREKIADDVWKLVRSLVEERAPDVPNRD